MDTHDQNPTGATNTDQIAQYHDDIRQIELEGYELRVRKARNALFLAAGLILLSEIIGYIRSGVDPEPIGISIVVIIIGSFVALALWTKRKPHTAVITGIILFTLYILLVAIINGYVDGAMGVFLGLVGGWLFKILIYVALFRHLGDAKELQAALDEKSK
ncbi:MAG: hypothetical protein JST86_02710 [Bacteroidetes bacterium]|nr:hypothetical protein [Bacteroidota bacterium]